MQATSSPSPRIGGRLVVTLLLLAAFAAGGWYWREQGAPPQARKGPGVIPVTIAEATSSDVPVRLTANGSISALQSVDVRAQISATISAVHVREGQFVRQGERLFSLDTRTEAANLAKAEAQVAKSRADLANAERNLKRQRELFGQKFISQTALDAAQNQVDSLRAQVASDLAAAEASRVALGYGAIVAPIAGRVGVVAVYPGSLVQPSGVPLASIARIDPINVSFTLPERELPALRNSMAAGDIPVLAQVDGGSEPAREGRLAFIDNSVDSSTGTILLKARLANGDSIFWPGMFVTVSLSSRTLSNALTVPIQAVQTGPERKFLYAVGEENKVSAVPVRVILVQDGRAVVEGVAAGTRVVVEGAQNLRPGSIVSDAGQAGKPAEGSGEGQRKQKPS